MALVENPVFEEEVLGSDGSKKLENFEEYPTDMKPGIKIKKLKKEFNTPQGTGYVSGP